MSDSKKSCSLKISVEDEKGLLSTLNSLKEKLGREVTVSDLPSIFLSHAFFSSSGKGAGRVKGDKKSPAEKGQEHKNGCCQAKIQPRDKSKDSYFCNANVVTGTSFCRKHAKNHVAQLIFKQSTTFTFPVKEKDGDVNTEFAVLVTKSGAHLAIDRDLKIHGRAVFEDGKISEIVNALDDDIEPEEMHQGSIVFRCRGFAKEGHRCSNSATNGFFCGRHADK